MPNIKRMQVESSNIDSFAYDAKKEVLTIWFKGGAEYTYPGVKQDTSNGLLEASSKGKYFAEHIKGKFTYKIMN